MLKKKKNELLLFTTTQNIKHKITVSEENGIITDRINFMFFDWKNNNFFKNIKKNSIQLIKKINNKVAEGKENLGNAY